VIEAVLEDRLGHESSVTPDDEAAARLIARHRPALDREPDPRRRRQKAYALLARNGFDPDTASRLARTIDGTGSDGEGDASDADEAG
jgi:SOS response regulatory protein OraA/RecX